jgi:hypothetical protein
MRMNASEDRPVVDCRGRTAQNVFLEILLHCLEAHDRGGQVTIEILHLERLNDSLTRLLKAVDRLRADLGADLDLADRSGYLEAFRRSLPSLTVL